MLLRSLSLALALGLLRCKQPPRVSSINDCLLIVDGYLLYNLMKREQMYICRRINSIL